MTWISSNCRNNKGKKENKNREKWNNHTTVGHYQPVPSQCKGGGSMVKGITEMWFGGGGKMTCFSVTN